MKQTKLPGSEITVSQLALGCWGLTSDFHWGTRDQATAKQIVAAALDAGITLFDTAAMYADGENEKLVGQLLAGHRDQVCIATKCPPSVDSVDALVSAVDDSLARLQTDYIDLYQIHWAGDDAPLGDVWQAMRDCRDRGKLRAIGVCNLGPHQMQVVTQYERPCTNQLPYNLLFRAIESEVLPCCKKAKTGVLAYSPLMHGMLRGQWQSADQVPPTRARTRHFSSQREHARHDEPGHEALTFETIECLTQFADVSHQSLLQLSLRWLASNKQVTSILVGASSPEQITENVAAIDRELDKEVLAQVKAVSQPLKEAMGDNVDLWQSATNSRIR